MSCLVVEDDVWSGEPQSMMKVRDESLGGGAAALVFSVGTFTAHVHARMESRSYMVSGNAPPK